ncbi:hypothetical protein DRP05_09170 [Archaeoglobales archaeon]|nr:MAG: hypothetical protein DRP05_09170 [Archaeoglobales archaeon]
MIHIFQVIGEPYKYEEKEFLIGGESYVSCFCSEALRKYIRESGGNVKLTIFVPESLLLNWSLEEICKKLNEKGMHNFEALIVPSIGEYKKDGGYVRYTGNVEAISTSIFLHFLKIRPETFYIDVSTGLNIYPLNMLEATKRYLTYRKLERLLQENSHVKAYTVFSPPILKDVYSYQVEIQPIDVKAFFSLPNANIDKIVRKCPESFRQKVGRINKEKSELKRNVRKVTEELKIAFNAIRLNVPLAFYELLDMNLPVEEIEKEIVDFVEAFLEPIEKEKLMEGLPVDGINVSNIFYSTALYKSIQKFVKTLSKPEIEEIFSRFSTVYRIKNLGIGVNEYFLLRDTEQIKETMKRAKIEEGKEELFGKLKYGENFSESTSAKRNFFAHSGFLLEYTLLKVMRKKIYVRWLENKRPEIKSWLLDPEKG